MPAVILWIVRLVPWLLSSVVGDNVLRFAAGKVLLTGLFMIVLPLVLNNFMYDIMNMMMGLVTDNTVTLSNFNGSMGFTGLAAHFLILLKAPECMSVLVASLAIRFSLSMIPFVRV